MRGDYNYLTVFQQRFSDLLTALQEHIILTGVAVILGCIVAIPLGVILTRISNEWIKNAVFNIVNIVQTIPSLALLAMLIPIFGVGVKPAIIALFLYSLMPILRNTYTGFTSIDPEITQAAEGMGYSSFQRVWKIEFPLALSYIMSGIRLTTVYIISWAVLAGFIGGGGLGELILAGIGLNDKPLVIAGSVVAMILTLIADFIFGKIEKAFTKGSQTTVEKAA